MATITVVTWNAQGSQGMNVASVASALSELAPDVVLLQEVQRRQLGALGVALGAVDSRWRFKHWGVRIPAEGLGLIAHVPLLEVRSQTLAHPLQFWNWRRRIALHCAVSVGERLVRIVDVHLGAGVTPAERTRQAEAVLAAAPNAAVIGGDLNAGPRDSELAVFAERGFEDAERRLHASSPVPATNWARGPRSDPPTQRLDYLLARPNAEVVSAFVPDNWSTWGSHSDHLPVVATLGF